MSRKESEYVADCDSCRGRTAKQVVDGAKCPSCSTGHFRLRAATRASAIPKPEREFDDEELSAIVRDYSGTVIVNLVASYRALLKFLQSQRSTDRARSEESE